MKLGRESVQQAERVVSVSRVLIFQDAVALEKKPQWLEGTGDARLRGRFLERQAHK